MEIDSNKTTLKTSQAITTTTTSIPNEKTTNLNQSSSSSTTKTTTVGLLDVKVPEILQSGTLMLKVSAKKSIRINVCLNYERGQIIWESKKGGSLNIESIREIRYGGEASYYRNQFKYSEREGSNWMTIIYQSKKSRYKMLHLICCSGSKDFEIWRETLERILNFRRELLGGLNHLRKRQAYWLKQYWNEADTTEDSKLEFHEIVGLCRRLNISVPESDIRSHFELADSQRRGYLDFQDFQRFVKLMKRRTELEEIFDGITNTKGSKFLSQDQFVKFMINTQKSQLNQTTLRMVYNKFLDDDHDDYEDKDHRSKVLEGEEDKVSDQNPSTVKPKQMTIDGFTTFLQSSDNSALSEDHLRVCQDMDLPICDYFLATSHNTYLVGNQLKGESTVEGYIRALQDGCRSVELDCWDGDSGEPVVYHGRTLTSKLLLSEALKVISKYAFVASPYPLVLSLEVHCQPAQQERLAELLRICLGESLLDKRLDEDLKDLLPSPKQLMYRILVKAKKKAVNSSTPAKPVDIVDSETTTSTTSGSTGSDSDFKRIISSASSAFGQSFKRISSAISSPSNSYSHEKHNQSISIESIPGVVQHSATITGSKPNLQPQSSSSSQSTQMIKKSNHVAPLTNALSDLLIYTIGVKARGFNKLTKYDPEHVLSLSERTVNKFIRGGELRVLDLISHTKGHLTRAYPSATRVFSSNFLPNRFWAAGIQLVACNWQTYDLGMQINMAFFNQNGRSGYILKPTPLRIKNKEKETAVKVHEYELRIKIISIQQLPKGPKNISSTTGVTNSNVGSSVNVTGGGSVGNFKNSNSNFNNNNSNSNNSNSKNDGDGEENEGGVGGFEDCKEDQVGMIDPFVEVQLVSPLIGSSHSVPSNFRRKTRSIKGNGFNPIFNEDFRIPFEVPAEMVELSFLRILVGDSREDEGIVGSVCTCLGSLQPGYRHLQLFDEVGKQHLFASVFFKSEIVKRENKK